MPTLTNTNFRSLLWLLLGSAFLFLYGIHKGEIYRTEGLRAILGAEMLRSGDWVLPRLYSEPILTKPPMHYWLIALTGLPWGEVTTVTARLPAAIASMLLCFILYFTLNRYLNDSAAVLLALLTPCAVLWLDKASTAEIDAVLVFWVTAAWACFMRIEDTSTARQKYGWYLLTLLCVAGGVLTKWTGFLFFYAMAVPYLLLTRRWKELFSLPHILAAILGASLCLLWLGLVVNRLGWETASQAWWSEAAPRLLHEKNRSTNQIWETLLHPFLVIGVNSPLSILALFSFLPRRISWPDQLKSLVLSLQCWAVAGTLMMSLFPDHNIRQSFSLSPAWTLLGALVGLAIYKGWLVLPKVTPHRMIQSTCTFLLLWCVAKIVYVEVLIPNRKTGKNIRATVAHLKDLVPPGQTLHIKGFKDECLMFRTSREVVRYKSWPRWEQARHWVLLPKEMEELLASGVVQIRNCHDMRDAQGDPFLLVELVPRSNEKMTGATR